MKISFQMSHLSFNVAKADHTDLPILNIKETIKRLSGAKLCLNFVMYYDK